MTLEGDLDRFVLSELTDDYSPIWEIASAVSQQFPMDSEAIQVAVKGALVRLHEQRLISLHRYTYSESTRSDALDDVAGALGDVRIWQPNDTTIVAFATSEGQSADLGERGP